MWGTPWRGLPTLTLGLALSPSFVLAGPAHPGWDEPTTAAPADPTPAEPAPAPTPEDSWEARAEPEPLPPPLPPDSPYVAWKKKRSQLRTAAGIMGGVGLLGIVFTIGTYGVASRNCGDAVDRGNCRRRYTRLGWAVGGVAVGSMIIGVTVVGIMIGIHNLRKPGGPSRDRRSRRMTFTRSGLAF